MTRSKNVTGLFVYLSMTIIHSLNKSSIQVRDKAHHADLKPGFMYILETGNNFEEVIYKGYEVGKGFVFDKPESPLRYELKAVEDVYIPLD